MASMAAIQEAPAAVRRLRRRASDGTYSLRRLNRDPLSVLRELQRTQGDVAKARVGGATLFLLSHPGQIGRVLVDQAHHYVRALTVCDRRAEPAPQPGQTMDTELDLESRRLVQPAFSRARVSRLWPQMAALGDERAATWPVGERIDLLEQVRALVVELAIQAVFEGDLDLPAAEIAEHARRCMQALLPATSRLQQLAELRHIGWLRSTGTAHAALAGTLARGLDERRAEGASANDALSLLLQAADRGGWTEENLITRAVALLLTFSDSTARNGLCAKPAVGT